MSEWPFVEAWWDVDLIFPDVLTSFSDRLPWSTCTNVRSGQPCVCAFCPRQATGIIRLRAWKCWGEISPNFDLWSLFHLRGFIQLWSFCHFGAEFVISAWTIFENNWACFQFSRLLKLFCSLVRSRCFRTKKLSRIFEANSSFVEPDGIPNGGRYVCGFEATQGEMTASRYKLLLHG
jgi:hypothetical protein